MSCVQGTARVRPALLTVRLLYRMAPGAGRRGRRRGARAEYTPRRSRGLLQQLELRVTGAGVRVCRSSVVVACQ